MKNHLGSVDASGPNRLLAALAVFLLASLLVGGHLDNDSRQSVARTQTPASAAIDHSRRDFYYLRSGQWLADLRTLVAACRFVLDPEPV